MASSQCQVQVSVNGGGWQSGGIVAVPFGATVALRNVSASPSSYVWELYDYPSTLALPSGWTSVGGVYTNYLASPVQLVMPTSGPTSWGKIPISLRINGNPLQYTASGSLNPAYLSSNTDQATILSIASPGYGMPGFCFSESTQFDSMRSWAGAIMANLRALDAVGGGGGATSWTNLTHATTGAVLTVTPGQSQLNVTLNTKGGACGFVFPVAPTDGLIVRVSDPPTGGPPLTCNWGTLAGTGTGSAGQYVENPAALGTFSALAGTVNMPGVNGAVQDFQWIAADSAWKCV